MTLEQVCALLVLLAVLSVPVIALCWAARGSRDFDLEQYYRETGEDSDPEQEERDEDTRRQARIFAEEFSKKVKK